MKIGVIGCGRIAQLAHLGLLNRLAGVTVAAIAEPDTAQCARAARVVPGAEVFADHQSLFERSSLDAVVLTLPPALHAAAAVDAFRRGLHVYVEKPLATSMADARAVVDAWKASGRIGMIGFNYRLHPVYQQARAHLRAARIGELVGARTVFASSARALPEWKRRRSSGGGALLDLASHHVDLAAFLFKQPVADVSAVVRSLETEGDTAAVTLRLAGGLPVQILCSIDSVAEDRFEILGTKGTLRIDRYAGTIEVGSGTHHTGRLGQLPREVRAIGSAMGRLLRPPGEPSFAAALEAFVAAVRRGALGPDDGSVEDGCRSLAVIEAAERSAESGSVVHVAAPDSARPV